MQRPDQRAFLFANTRQHNTQARREDKLRDAAVIEVLEKGNDDRVLELEARVTELKDVSTHLNKANLATADLSKA